MNENIYTITVQVNSDSTGSAEVRKRETNEVVWSAAECDDYLDTYMLIKEGEFSFLAGALLKHLILAARTARVHYH